MRRSAPPPTALGRRGRGRRFFLRGKAPRRLEFRHFERSFQTGNPARIAITQPRVARNELPWETSTGVQSTLKELNRRKGLRVVTSWHNHWRRYHLKMSFVTSCCGMNWKSTSDICWTDATLSELIKHFGFIPRVARSSQPWAELYNPYGIGFRIRQKTSKIQFSRRGAVKSTRGSQNNNKLAH